MHLMLPHTHNQNTDQDEEARVVFVGATRGRSRLLIGRGYRQYASRVEASGRAYSVSRQRTGQTAPRSKSVETPISVVEGLAGRNYFRMPALCGPARPGFAALRTNPYPSWPKVIARRASHTG